MGAGMHW